MVNCIVRTVDCRFVRLAFIVCFSLGSPELSGRSGRRPGQTVCRGMRVARGRVRFYRENIALVMSSKCLGFSQKQLLIKNGKKILQFAPSDDTARSTIDFCRGLQQELDDRSFEDGVTMTDTWHQSTRLWLLLENVTIESML